MMFLFTIFNILSIIIFISFFLRRAKRFRVEGVITGWDAISIPMLLICLAVPVLNVFTAAFLLLTMSFDVSYKHFGSWYKYYLNFNKIVLFKRSK